MNTYDDLDIVDDDGRHHVADPELCKIAVEIEKAWAALVTTYSPTASGMVRSTYRQQVYKAAKLCKRLGQDPLVFVRVQLEGMMCNGWKSKALSPKDLAREKWVADPFYSKASMDAKTTRELESEVEVVHARAGVLGLVNVIRDPSTPISALTRVVLAWESDPKLLDIVRHYLRQAKLDYNNSPVAQSFFADCDLGFLHDNTL